MKLMSLRAINNSKTKVEDSTKDRATHSKSHDTETGTTRVRPFSKPTTYEEVIALCFPEHLSFPSNELVYGCLALSGETGEVIEKVKKIARDKGGEISPDDRLAILKELSDVLWAVTTCARSLNSTLAEVIAIGKQKMEGRLARGTLQGSGDDR